jgi:hypothetical protein
MPLRSPLALAAALLASAGPPSPLLAPPPAGAAPFSPGEQIDMEVEYLHVRAGVARFVVGKPEGAVWPIICQGRTDGLGRLLDIREHFVSYWDAGARASRGSDLNAVEVGDRHTDRARFDRERGKAVVQVLRKGRLQESTKDVPRDVHDLASALLDLRLRPLAAGARFELPVLHGTHTFVLRAEVEGKENVSTPAGRFEAWRVKVRLGFADRFETRRDSFVWLSTDDRHVPVRMSADFAVGTVVATLTGYRPGGQFAAR